MVGNLPGIREVVKKHYKIKIIQKFGFVKGENPII